MIIENYTTHCRNSDYTFCLISKAFRLIPLYFLCDIQKNFQFWEKWEVELLTWTFLYLFEKQFSFLKSQFWGYKALLSIYLSVTREIEKQTRVINSQISFILTFINNLPQRSICHLICAIAHLFVDLLIISFICSFNNCFIRWLILPFLSFLVLCFFRSFALLVPRFTHLLVLILVLISLILISNVSFT
jgi:hypothetical protein